MFKIIKALFLVMGGLLFLPSLTYADITIAAVGAMSGGFAKIGEEFRQGTRGAVENINDNGGLLGQKIKFIVRDDNCDAKEAVKIAKELVSLDIKMVMGHLCSAASIAASDIYEKNGIIQISPASTSPDYTDRGKRFIFRTTGRDDMQGFVIAEHMIRNYKTKKFGIIYDDDTYSKGIADISRSFLKQAGMEADFYEKAPTKPYDFSSLLKLIKEKNIRVVLYPGLPPSIIAFASQVHKAGLKVRPIGGDAYTGIIFNDTNRRFLDGAQFSFQPDPNDDRKNKVLVEKYKASGFKPKAFTLYGYAAVDVWSQAVKKAGSLDAPKVSAALHSEKFDTVLGNITFDEKGDISNPGFVMYFFNKGKRYYLD